MLAAWTEILPLFLVRWIARHRCEIFSALGKEWVHARPDVLIELPKR